LFEGSILTKILLNKVLSMLGGFVQTHDANDEKGRHRLRLYQLPMMGCDRAVELCSTDFVSPRGDGSMIILTSPDE
jgi:hypothetical protein